MDGFIYNILADPEQTVARLRGREVRLLCKSPFSLTLLDADTCAAVAQAAAELSPGGWRATALEYSEEEAAEADSAPAAVPAPAEDPAEEPAPAPEAPAEAEEKAETESKLDRLMRRFDIKYDEGE